MSRFAIRSRSRELLDETGIPFEQIRRNMQELDVINTRLGGHAITCYGLKKVVELTATNKRELHIVEIGCGGGDNLRVLQQYCRENHIPARFTGIDINPHCISFAKQRNSSSDMRWVVSDYRDMNWEEKPDVIFSSLFSHHFSDQDLVEQLGWMKLNSRIGFFINDLHRHPVAYYSISLLTFLFSKSELVRHDAPVSVLRGFRRKEWERYLQAAGLNQARVHWRWAFRWLVIFRHPIQQHV